MGNKLTRCYSIYVPVLICIVAMPYPFGALFDTKAQQASSVQKQEEAEIPAQAEDQGRDEKTDTTAVLSAETRGDSLTQKIEVKKDIASDSGTATSETEAVPQEESPKPVKQTKVDAEEAPQEEKTKPEEQDQEQEQPDSTETDRDQGNQPQGPTPDSSILQKLEDAYSQAVTYSKKSLLSIWTFLSWPNLVVGFLIGSALAWYLTTRKKNKPDDITDSPSVNVGAHVLRFGNAQGIGSRKEQQDAFGFCDVNDKASLRTQGVVSVLADGMGGLAMGAEASNRALSSFLAAYANVRDSELSIDNKMAQAITAANQSVAELAHENHLYGNVGTTLVATCIKDDVLHWISVGDSRIYLFRGGQLTQLTVDHNFRNQLINESPDGQLPTDQVENPNDLNALTSYLGLDEIAEIDQNHKPYGLKSNDRLILCSDGLSGTLTEPEIIAGLEGDPQAAAEKLLAQVLEKNNTHQDNTTIIVLQFV